MDGQMTDTQAQRQTNSQNDYSLLESVTLVNDQFDWCGTNELLEGMTCPRTTMKTVRAFCVNLLVPM